MSKFAFKSLSDQENGVSLRTRTVRQIFISYFRDHWQLAESKIKISDESSMIHPTGFKFQSISCIKKNIYRRAKQICCNFYLLKLSITKKNSVCNILVTQQHFMITIGRDKEIKYTEKQQVRALPKKIPQTTNKSLFGFAH